MSKFYVYLYRDENGVPLYVGKGTGKRAWKHKRRFNNQPEIIAQFDDEEEAFAHEIALIARFGRRDRGTGTLHNLTDGGDGVRGVAQALKVINRTAELASDPGFVRQCLEGLQRAAQRPYFKHRSTMHAEKIKQATEQWKQSLPEPVKRRQRGGRRGKQRRIIAAQRYKRTKDDLPVENVEPKKRKRRGGRRHRRMKEYTTAKIYQAQ